MTRREQYLEAVEATLTSQEEWEASRMQKEQDLLNVISDDISDEPEDDLSGSEESDESEKLNSPEEDE